jgi:hypothetical protein
MVLSISRKTYENARDGTADGGTTLLADYRREVAGGERIIVEEPDGSKSLLQFSEDGEPFTTPIES